MDASDLQTEKPITRIDWQQVVLNGGPPCFFVEGPQYCGRAERWPGHDSHHKFVSLDDLLATVRKEEREAVFKEAIEIVDRLVCDPEYDGNWRNGYGHAQNDMQDALEQAAEK